MVIIIPSAVVWIAIYFVRKIWIEGTPPIEAASDSMGCIGGLILVAGVAAFFWYGLGFKDNKQVIEFWSDFF